MFSSDSRFLALDLQEKGLEVLEVGTGKDPVQLADDGDATLTRRFLLSEGRNGFRVWSTVGGAPVANLPVPGELLASAVSGNGSVLVTASQNEPSVRVWDLAQARQIEALPAAERVRALAISPEGDRVAILFGRPLAEASRYGALEWWIEVRSPSEPGQEAEYTLGEEEPRGLLFHTDGRRLLVVWAGTARVVDTSGHSVSVDLSDAEELRRIRFAPDHEHVAAISANRARVWSLADGRFVSLPSATGDAVNAIAFDAAGRYLATAGTDNDATLQYWLPSDLLVQACRRLVRNLTAVEWRDFLGEIPYRQTCSNLPRGDTAARL